MDEQILTHDIRNGLFTMTVTLWNQLKTMYPSDVALSKAVEYLRILADQLEQADVASKGVENARDQTIADYYKNN